MVSKFCLVLIFFLLFFCNFLASGRAYHGNSNGSGIELPDHTDYNSVSSSANTKCSFETSSELPLSSISIQERDNNDKDVVKHMPSLKFPLKHRSDGQKTQPKELYMQSTKRDFLRIQTLYRRMKDNKNQKATSRLKQTINIDKQPVEVVAPPAASPESSFSGQLIVTLESGVSLGSGEYFMDVFIGTPPKHFSLILDTGSDLNWIQCLPCYDCFEQNGPYYDPKESTSFRNISCHDPRCSLVSSPDPPQTCESENQTCPYYYWYGDSSNTTGDFSLETFTLNLTTLSGKSEIQKAEDVMFGCGHWNRGLFHGAAGLLGLGRGPLSFSTQLQSLYGESFSYCLVDRNSNSSVSSKLIFGEDKELLKHPQLNFTSLVAGKDNPVDTFYYVEIKSILIGGVALDIPEETWKLSKEGVGGTIIDSGTTLSYFTDPANKTIRDTFVKKLKNYPIVEDYLPLYPCYNVSVLNKEKFYSDVPSFGIEFTDGAIWNFPIENYFIKLEPEEVMCLAILGNPRSALSIIGNYQQQNFHILYDTKNSRLGFAPTNCADV